MQALYHLTQDARSDAAGDRQRRLGERRDRHHRHPRLRRRSGADRAALPRRRNAAAAVPPRAARRAAAGARATSRSGAADRAVRVRRHRATPRDRGTWGYSRVPTARGVRGAVHARCSRRSARSACSPGFCYTQFADTYQEANGLLFADRTPKIPAARRSPLATRGRNREPPRSIRSAGCAVAADGRSSER